MPTETKVKQKLKTKNQTTQATVCGGKKLDISQDYAR